MDITEKNLFTYTCTLLCAELMANYMEDLKDTPYYKQGIKNKCNSLIPDIETILKNDFTKIYAHDEMYVVNCMNHMKKLVESISTLNSSDIIEYTQLLDEFKKDKDKFLDKHQLVLKKLDE